jgi:hypothetical protein
MKSASTGRVGVSDCSKIGMEDAVLRGCSQISHVGNGGEPQKSLGTDQKFGLTEELLYGGQGKTSKLNNNLFHTDMHSEATGHWVIRHASQRGLRSHQEVTPSQNPPNTGFRSG